MTEGIRTGAAGRTCPLCGKTDGDVRHRVVYSTGLERHYHIDCHSRMSKSCVLCTMTLDQIHAMGQFLNDNDRESWERERRKLSFTQQMVPPPQASDGAPEWLQMNEFTSALKPEDHAWLRQQEIWLPEPKPAPVEKRRIRRTASGNNPIVLVLFFAVFAMTMASLLTNGPIGVTVSLIIAMVGLGGLIDRNEL